MPGALSLDELYDGVVARLGVAGVTAPHSFGWRVLDEHVVTSGRYVWTPGDPSGLLGAVLSAKQPGRNPRPLATLEELFTVTISASDGAPGTQTASDERAQYRAVRRLYDVWFAAAYDVAHGTFRVVTARWLTNARTRSHGAALEVVVALEAMIPSLTTAARAPTNPRAVVVVRELDHAETIETAPAPPAVRAAAVSPVVLAGEFVVDGVALEDGDRVLVTAQTDAEDNGVYVVSTGAWPRAEDADDDAEVTTGLSFVRVLEGDVYADHAFALTTPAPVALGTTPLTFIPTTPAVA